MSIGFEHPLMMVLGFIIVVLGVLVSPHVQDAFSLRVPLGPPGGVPFKPPLRTALVIKILSGLELLGLLFLFIADAGPFFISTETVWLNRGMDIIFVVDVSPSMAALDLGSRSRFSLARNLIADFAAGRPSDAIGLVGVGSDAALLLPPTVDRQSLFSRLETLRIGELGDGTALGMGLALGGLHIKDSLAPRKAVILLTDGENNAGAIHPETAAEVLPPLGASLWVIGIGSGGEVPIDYLDPLTKVRRTGIFDSRFDPETLKAIARKGEGIYLPAPSAEALSQAFSRINEQEMTIGRSGTITRAQEFHIPFIIGGIFLMGLVHFIRRYLWGAFL